jgi:hypothetical protein
MEVVCSTHPFALHKVVTLLRKSLSSAPPLAFTLLSSTSSSSSFSSTSPTKQEGSESPLSNYSSSSSFSTSSSSAYSSPSLKRKAEVCEKEEVEEKDEKWARKKSGSSPLSSLRSSSSSSLPFYFSLSFPSIPIPGRPSLSPSASASPSSPEILPSLLSTCSSSSSTPSSFSTLPFEVLLEVFSYLSLEERVLLSLVNQEWKLAATFDIRFLSFKEKPLLPPKCIPFLSKRCQNLKHLALPGNFPIDELSTLSSLQHLTTLELYNAEVMIDEQIPFLTMIPSLTHLDLRCCKKLTDLGLSYISRNSGISRNNLSPVLLLRVPLLSLSISGTTSEILIFLRRKTSVFEPLSL